MRIGVLTSGGDAPGMNAAVRAVVRRTLARNGEPFVVYDGYSGLVEGGSRIAPVGWEDVGRILHLGGTELGTSRCEAFRTTTGRRDAVFHLVERGISRLVVVGGDGSLTGANTLRLEWGGHVDELVREGRLTAEQARLHGRLGLVGLAGSIDNDLVGTDRTIGCDTALHRIVDAVDRLTSTARSHQRSFVVEVMGRRSGFLALAAAVCTGADHVIIPEKPAEDWRQDLVASLWRSREQGRRKSIVLLAEGASDRHGEPIRSADVREVIERELAVETRITVLGHVQRGGDPSAYDRIQSTALGIAAVDRLAASSRREEAVVMGTAGPEVTVRSLAESVKATHGVERALREGRFAEALSARGPEVRELMDAWNGFGRPRPLERTGKRILLAHVGAPAPGMNAAIHAFEHAVRSRGHQPLYVQEGLKGLLAGDLVKPDVAGIPSLGATVLGTNRWRPQTAGEWTALRKALSAHEVDGLVLVGGFGALEAASGMRLPCAVVPATISNNVPGTQASVGADTAVNAICEAVDRLKQSAIGSRHRVFFVEVMGRRCGWLARSAAVGCGAELVYTDEEPITLERLQQDVQGLNEAMDAGRTVGIVLVADGVPEPFRAERLAGLFQQASEGRFDTRVCVLGHLQQGGSPSPADRLLATRLIGQAVEHVVSSERAVVVGAAAGEIRLEKVSAALNVADREARRPKFVRPMPSFKGKALYPRSS